MTPEEANFLRAIILSPEPRAVAKQYADWLDGEGRRSKASRFRSTRQPLTAAIRCVGLPEAAVYQYHRFLCMTPWPGFATWWSPENALAIAEKLLAFGFTEEQVNLRGNRGVVSVGLAGRWLYAHSKESLRRLGEQPAWPTAPTSCVRSSAAT